MNNIANDWIVALKRKVIKNISHHEFIQKYSGIHINLKECVLILQGLRKHVKCYFFIRIHAAMYESFKGPHLVQIGDATPFWVHSLTAFRRDFFNLTDKLSFERSVFVCLSDGNVVRLKIIRPYLKVNEYNANNLFNELQYIQVYRNPYKFFRVSKKDYEKQINIINYKKIQTIEQQKSVRLRVRHQLVQSMQQIFCGYIRDPHVQQHDANQWFKTDVQYALECCNDIYNQINVKSMNDDVINTFYNIPTKPKVASMNEINNDVIMNLHNNGTKDDEINSIIKTSNFAVTYDVTTASLF
jgi:hypothetical protein